MIRKISAGLIGLALTLPMAVATVSAHTSGGLVITDDVRVDGAIVGTVANHTSSRRTNIQVTATWENGATDITETVTAFVSNLAPHAASPFQITEPAEADGLVLSSVTATSTTTSTKPTGGLTVDPCVLVGNVCTGTVHNDSAVAGDNIEVYAVRLNGGVTTGAAASEPVDVGAMAAGQYVITFDADSSGTVVDGYIARSNAGAFLTSWNNYFGDLGTTNFVTEIAWMASQGITLGCGDANFCPKSNVTREQMAVFLDRALGLPDDTDGTPFTDISGLSAASQQAIANLHNEGITGGCTATTYCPSQTVTREQMAAFLDRGYEFPTTTTDAFTDDETSFAEASINDVAAAGVTGGCTATTYCPKAAVTREQMAAFIYRAEN